MWLRSERGVDSGWAFQDKTKAPKRGRLAATNLSITTLPGVVW